MNCITVCLSEMNTRFSSSGLPISSANVCKNHTQESLFSCPITLNATGKILSFSSLAVADNICPPNLPFKWQPSNPTSGLHLPQESNFLCIVSHIHPFELGLCVRLSNLSLQNHLTLHISYSYHLYIVLKLPILQPLIT